MIYEGDRLCFDTLAVAVQLTITFKSPTHTHDTELIVIEVVTSNSKPVILYIFYRPPDSTPDVFQSLNNSLQRNKESSRKSDDRRL